MNSKVFHRTTCRLCNSSNLEVGLKLKPSALADAYVLKDKVNIVQDLYPLDLTLCHDCGYVQVPDVVDPEIIYRDYIYVSTSSMGLAAHFEKYADEVLNGIKPKTGSLVMDIGCNDGILLGFFKKKDMRVLGVEPASEIAKKLTASGIETLPEFFNSKIADEIRGKYGAASIVTANNIYANVEELVGFTVGVRKLLAPDGVFVFESFYLGDLMKNMVFDFIYHEHLSYFSVKPLDLFFRRNGMELIDVKRVPTKGGSLRYTVQLAGGPRPKSPVVSEFIEQEKKIGLDRTDIFSAFDARINEIKAELLKVLKELKGQGKTIAGYGASATTTTLLYHLELADFIDYIVDDNLAKQYTYSPGYHIPVVPSDELYNRKPNYVLIFAWRYFEPIMKRHQAYVKEGNHFILPLPKVKVL